MTSAKVLLASNWIMACSDGSNVLSEPEARDKRIKEDLEEEPDPSLNVEMSFSCRTVFSSFCA